MNILATLLHAYQSIAASHPEKDAFQIVADVEDLVKRLVAAADLVKTVESTTAAPQA